MRQVAFVKRSEVLSAIAEVEELTDEMPDEMLDAIKDDKDAMAEAFRAVVRSTKTEAVENIMKLGFFLDDDIEITP